MIFKNKTLTRGSKKMFTDRLADKFRERSDSLLSLTSHPKTTRKRGNSAGCMTIESYGSQKLVVLGAPYVGKTTICSTYAASINGQGVTRSELYRSCVFIKGQETNLVKQIDIEIAVPQGTLWNGSVIGYKKLILESDGYLLVYSKENIQSYMKLIEIVSDIRKLRKCNYPPIVIVGNKNDLDLGNTMQIKDSEHIVLGDFPHFNLSALENDGVQEAFKCLVQSVSLL